MHENLDPEKIKNKVLAIDHLLFSDLMRSGLVNGH